MLNIDINRLTDICLDYQQSRFYVTRIPKDFLSIANTRFSIPTDDQIIAFLSCNLFGSENMAFTLQVQVYTGKIGY